MYHPEERHIYEVLDVCESAVVRDALAYSALEHFVRRVPEWVHEQVASEASVGNVYRIYRTVRCVADLRLHQAGEILLHMLVALGPEVDAQVQAQPQRARLRNLRDTLRAGEPARGLRHSDEAATRTHSSSLARARRRR